MMYNTSEPGAVDNAAKRKVTQDDINGLDLKSNLMGTRVQSKTMGEKNDQNTIIIQSKQDLIDFRYKKNDN